MLLGVYQRRQPEKTAFYQAIQNNLETFFAEVEVLQNGTSFPKYVRDEFDRYLKCGILAHGFARYHCDTCDFNRIVAFSCQCRGICTSCQSRKMHDTAYDLVENNIDCIFRPCRRQHKSRFKPLFKALKEKSYVI